MTYEDVKKQIELDAAINALEQRGEINYVLQPYWEEYQKMNPEAEPGPEFAQQMRQVYEANEQAGQGQYSEAPARAGPPKFDWKSFLTKKPWTNE